MNGATNVHFPSGPYGGTGSSAPLAARRTAPIVCERCGEACRGEVVRVKNTHFHLHCFTCQVCGCDLVLSGFFLHSGEFLCTDDFQRLHGTTCDGCQQLITGEVVSALGRTYHTHCFTCSTCRSPFPIGDRVTFIGKKCVCQQCSHTLKSDKPVKVHGPSSACAGCGQQILHGASLLALGSQWHVSCFKCRTCSCTLTGEYISKDGAPYCERDYHTQFGIRCDTCSRYISGRVLEAGGKHYHPSCARCVRCHMMFLEGEEMYLTGSEVWHPECKEAARLERKLRLRRSSETPSPQGSSPLLGSPHHLLYSKVDGDVLDYKQLAALPRVTAVYDLQRPDIIPHQADHTHTHLSEDTHSRRQSLGSLSPYAHDLLDGVELRARRRSSSSAFTDSPSHSRHGGSPLHCYLPGSESGRSSPYYSEATPPAVIHGPKHFHVPASEETSLYRRPPIYQRQDSSSSPSALKTRPNENLLTSNGVYHPASNYYPSSGSPKVSRVRRFSCGGEEDGWNHNINKVIGRLILKEEMKAQRSSRCSSSCSSKEALNNQEYSSLNGSPRSLYSTDSDSYVAKSSSLPGYGRNNLNRPGNAGADYYQYDSSNDVNWQIRGQSASPPQTHCY
ncbi:actin-binding LIM protein 3-like isoform X1 [Centropristis striata]|uniref:actin-binding LIM protein 3-like isoform X1 n=1 Tax=Centropristis striata TaxID=184440 RepID=UPI0027E19387|nr:actin-binding LIM protein 3-like isoform X1 [Centropristis striata]